MNGMGWATKEGSKQPVRYLKYMVKIEVIAAVQLHSCCSS